MLTESDDIISKSFLLFYPTAETFCWLLRQIQFKTRVKMVKATVIPSAWLILHFFLPL